MMHHRRVTCLYLLLAAAVLAGCGNRPEVDAALGPAPEGADYPELLSIEAILAVDGEISEEDLDENEALLQRADSLRARAGAL